MELAEVSRLPSPFLTVRETARLWEVSERTLRRRLATGAPGCYQDKTGQWILSVEWVSSQFHRRKFGSISGNDDDTKDDNSTDTEHDRNGVTEVAGTIADGWVRELVETERRATRAETELELAKRQIEQLRTELQTARSDLNYERSLVNRLKDQIRGNSQD